MHFMFLSMQCIIAGTCNLCCCSATVQSVWLERVSAGQVDRCPHAAAERSHQGKGKLRAMSATTGNVAGGRWPDVSVGNDRCHRWQSCRKSFEASLPAVRGKQTLWHSVTITHSVLGSQSQCCMFVFHFVFTLLFKWQEGYLRFIHWCFLVFF